MELLINPVEELYRRYADEGKIIEVDQEAQDLAIKVINDEMARFSLDQRSYFNRSIESARKAYLTF